MKRLVLGALLAVAGAWFMDPQSGARRRAMARDRALAFVRSGGRRTAQMAGGVSAAGYGAVQKAAHVRDQPKSFDDATLKAKVETEIFRDADAPKGRVDVNAQEGVVQLRGEVDSPQMIEDLVARTRKIQGVKDVENLLHTPGAEAPMHQ